MIFEEFKQDVMDAANARPEFIRKGQAVFNYVDEVYGVARLVQFHDRIDCFYNDYNIDEFLEAAFKYITEVHGNFAQ